MLSVIITIPRKIYCQPDEPFRTSRRACPHYSGPGYAAGAVAAVGATSLAGLVAAMCQEPCALFAAAADGSSLEKARARKSSALASTEASSPAAGQTPRGAWPASSFERKELPTHRSELGRRISPPSRNGGSPALCACGRGR